LLLIEENQLGRRNLPDDQRVAIALRVADRRTALALSQRNKAAVEHRYVEAPVGHNVAVEQIETPPKTRIRAQIAKAGRRHPATKATSASRPALARVERAQKAAGTKAGRYAR